MNHYRKEIETLSELVKILQDNFASKDKVKEKQAILKQVDNLHVVIRDLKRLYELEDSIKKVLDI